MMTFHGIFDYCDWQYSHSQRYQQQRPQQHSQRQQQQQYSLVVHSQKRLWMVVSAICLFLLVCVIGNHPTNAWWMSSTSPYRYSQTIIIPTTITTIKTQKDFSTRLWSSSSSSTSTTSDNDNHANAAVTSTTTTTTAKNNNDETIIIRDCEYAELNTVTDIIMESFYDKKKPLKGLYKIAELNRLQQNFPYTDQQKLHRMVVATITTTTNNDDDTTDTIVAATTTTTSTKVIGFCDIDARPCKTKQKLPRPYLSDLAIDPNYRRRGIAKTLVKYCEDFIKDIAPTTTITTTSDPQQQQKDEKTKQPELWIRVQESNHAAISMYKNLNYTITSEEEDPQQGPVLVLHKLL